MPDAPDQPNPTYATHHWGPLADDPWQDVAPDSQVWWDAVKRAWLHSGGTEAQFQRIFNRPAR